MTDTYTYDAHDKLTSTSSKTYTYDNNGNCTSVTVGGNTTSLTYDYENRVTGITYQGGATNSFQYNGNNLRTRKVDSAGTFNYTTNGTSPASPVLKDGAATYTPGLSERRGSTSKFYHGEALGSTRGITDSTQAVTDSVIYDGFGMVVNRTGTTPTPFGFVGAAQYQTDNDSGLMLLGNRYYDSSIGRFLSQDPIRDGDNWYVYCDNNPLAKIDAEGTSCDDLKKKIEKLAKNVEQRWRDMEEDRGKLWEAEQEGRNVPNVEGNWSGHQYKYRQEQEELNRLIDRWKNGPCGGGRGGRSLPDWVGNWRKKAAPTEPGYARLPGYELPHLRPSTGQQYVKPALTTGLIVSAGILLWELVKWGSAIGTAPATGGLSLGGAASLP